jgi:hypothetical protein
MFCRQSRHFIRGNPTGSKMGSQYSRNTGTMTVQETEKTMQSAPAVNTMQFVSQARDSAEWLPARAWLAER